MSNLIDDFLDYCEDVTPVIDDHKGMVYGLAAFMMGLLFGIGFIIGRFVGKHNN